MDVVRDEEQLRLPVEVEGLDPLGDDELADLAELDDEHQADALGWRAIGLRAAQLGHHGMTVFPSKSGRRWFYRCSCMDKPSRLSWVNEVQALLMARRHLLESVRANETHDRAFGVSSRRTS